MEAPACNLFLLARSRHAKRLIICFVYFYSMGLLAYRTEMENPGDVAAFNVFSHYRDDFVGKQYLSQTIVK